MDNKPFLIIIEEVFFKEGDIITTAINGYKMKVIKTYYSKWRRFLYKFLNIGYPKNYVKVQINEH